MQECRERDVFDAVAAWAYGLIPTHAESLAQSIADVEGLLLLIRFPLMTPTELQVRPLYFFPVLSRLHSCQTSRDQEFQLPPSCLLESFSFHIPAVIVFPGCQMREHLVLHES